MEYVSLGFIILLALPLQMCSGEVDQNEAGVAPPSPLSSKQDWFPGQVRLRSLGRDNYNSILVGQGWVLTAASVFRDNYKPDLWGALVVSNNSNGAEGAKQTRLYVQHIYIHGRYLPPTSTSSARHDLALVKLSTNRGGAAGLNLQAQTKFAPVDLPEEGRQEVDGKCFLIRWGSADKETARPTTLRVRPVNLLNATECNSRFGPGSAFPGQLCQTSTRPEDGPCPSDIGSPILCWRGRSWQVAAVVNHEFGCGNQGNTTPGTFTDVAYYIPWIDKMMTTF